MPLGRLTVPLGRMAAVSTSEPPDEISYSLDEALSLLAALEDARDVLVISGHLAAVVSVENEIRLLSRRLGFEEA